MPHAPRVPTIAEELDREHAELAYWKAELRIAIEAKDVPRIIECRTRIGGCTQRIRNLLRELQEGY